MIVKAWKGGTYGIYVGRTNVRKYFSFDWNHIDVDIDGKFHRFDLNSTFWTTCPEFRGFPIPDWLRLQGLTKWPEGKPPNFELIPLESNKFRLLKGKT